MQTSTLTVNQPAQYGAVRNMQSLAGATVNSMDMTDQIVLIALQVFQVAFLWFHDWIPLGRLNDVRAVRNQDTLQRLIVVTLIQSVPWTIGLVFSGLYFGQSYPDWLGSWLRGTYVILFLGELYAWWVPYLVRVDAKRAARYQIMFGNTHSFLPLHNGIVPNTLHVVLHASTAATLVMLFAFFDGN
ncbi:hypothetical protein P3T24_006446 [Paraburkholderia sp. GAS33]|jgi:hypothetical protein|uniref:hypothetical protein n=1 Tax=Paraburkholderia sp. GAS33 TaxID=3035130 RepID=UPI003D2499FC